MKKVVVFIIVLLMSAICYGQIAIDKKEKLKYPVDADTVEEKMTFCYIAQEKLRLEHNAKGKDYREGKITEAEWKKYLEDDFDIKQSLIIEDLLIQKEAMKNSTKYEVDLNDLEKKD